MRGTLKVLIGLYIGAACLTLIFVTYVRWSRCAGVSDCGVSLAKGTAWSVIWPAFWPLYVNAAPEDVTVDEEWYLSQYPDVRDGIRTGRFKSALDHYRANGYFEKRLPSKPVVCKAWYLKRYPFVAQAIREGRETSAYDHYMKYGCRDGLAPCPGPVKRQVLPHHPAYPLPRC